MLEEKKTSSYKKNLLIILATSLLTTIIVIGGLTYYIVAKNPFNIQACLISSFLSASLGDESDASAGPARQEAADFDHPMLSEEQETMLENAGIDVGSLPTAISPAMESCFIKILGQERVNEIKAGAVPGPLDIFRVKSCL